jgi:carbon starvation protein
MRQVIFNDYVNASLTGLFMLVLISLLAFGIQTVIRARGTDTPTAKEAPFEPLSPLGDTGLGVRSILNLKNKG